MDTITLLEFTVPGDSVPQGRPRAARRGNRIMMYDPKASKEYKQYVSLIAKQNAPKNPFQGALCVDIDIYRRIPKSTSEKQKWMMQYGTTRPVVKSDIDNYTKSILDSLNKITYLDDSQVVELNARKYYSDEPRAEIRIREIE